MIDFTRIRDDANGIDTILFECNDEMCQLEGSENVS